MSAEESNLEGLNRIGQIGVIWQIFEQVFLRVYGQDSFHN